MISLPRYVVACSEEAVGPERYGVKVEIPGRTGLTMCVGSAFANPASASLAALVFKHAATVDSVTNDIVLGEDASKQYQTMTCFIYDAGSVLTEISVVDALKDILKERSARIRKAGGKRKRGTADGGCAAAGGVLAAPAAEKQQPQQELQSASKRKRSSSSGSSDTREEIDRRYRARITSFRTSPQPATLCTKAFGTKCLVTRRDAKRRFRAAHAETEDVSASLATACAPSDSSASAATVSSSSSDKVRLPRSGIWACVLAQEVGGSGQHKQRRFTREIVEKSLLPLWRAFRANKNFEMSVAAIHAGHMGQGHTTDDALVLGALVVLLCAGAAEVHGFDTGNPLSGVIRTSTDELAWTPEYENSFVHKTKRTECKKKMRFLGHWRKKKEDVRSFFPAIALREDLMFLFMLVAPELIADAMRVLGLSGEGVAATGKAAKRVAKSGGGAFGRVKKKPADNGSRTCAFPGCFGKKKSVKGNTTGTRAFCELHLTPSRSFKKWRARNPQLSASAGVVVQRQKEAAQQKEDCEAHPLFSAKCYYADKSLNSPCEIYNCACNKNYPVDGVDWVGECSKCSGWSHTLCYTPSTSSFMSHARRRAAARAAPKHDFKDTDFGSIEGFVCMMCDPTLKVLYAHRQMLEGQKSSGVDTGDMEEC